MKKQIFVLVPYDVPPTEINVFERLLLDEHRSDPDDPGRGRWDYMVGALRKAFNDRIAEGRLPPRIRRMYSGNICELANLPLDVVPFALVTSDGEWHDLFDFGWRIMPARSEDNFAARKQWTERYHQLIAAHANCWVIEVWAHS